MRGRDVLALVVALLLNAAAIVVVVQLKKRLEIEDWGAVVIVVLVPLIVYGILSGRLSEVTAPGGWVAKFREAAHSSVDFEQATVDMSEMQMIPKVSVDEVKRRASLVADGRPIVLTLTLARGQNYYTTHALLEVLKALGQHRNFKFVLFLDPENRAVAYIPTWALRSALESADGSGQALVQAVNDGRREEILSLPAVITEFVGTSATNVEALRAMERRNFEALVVVDGASREPRGVAERDRILSRMMLALAKASAKATKAA